MCHRHLLACLTFFASVHCLPLTSQVKPSLVYQARSNRHEGLHPDFNAKPRYEIRGFFAREELPSTTKGYDLKVSFYIPAQAKLVEVQAQELQNVKNYGMIANLPIAGAVPGDWATFSPWPVSEVLDQVSLLPSKLGVLVSLKLPNATYAFAPAILYTGNAPSTINTYSIFFATDKPTTSVRCTVRDASGQDRAANGSPYTCSLPNKEAMLPSGVTRCFVIDAANLPEGLTTVTISGEYANDESGDSLHAVLHFYHQPRVNIR